MRKWKKWRYWIKNWLKLVTLAMKEQGIFSKVFLIDFNNNYKIFLQRKKVQLLVTYQ